MKQPILRCRFPFPPHDPPLEMPEACLGRCPNADPKVLAKHASIAPDDEALLAVIRDFLSWFYAPDQDLDEQLRHAAILYTRDDHDGTCVPKTVLFMHYKHLQFLSGGPALELSEAARRALDGETVASWPDGEPAAGDTWDQMFRAYTRGYE